MWNGLESMIESGRGNCHPWKLHHGKKLHHQTKQTKLHHILLRHSHLLQ